MAGALGLLLGAGVGAAAGEIRQKRQQQQKHDDALFDFYSKNPTLVADSPDAQKFVTKYGGKDTAAAFIGMANHTKAAAEQFGKITGGEQQGGAASGGAPTAGPVPAAGGQPQPASGQRFTAPGDPPDDPKALRAHADKIEQFLLNDPGAQYLTEDKRKFGMEHAKELRDYAKELEEQAQRAKYESPEAKATASTATEKAKKAVDTSPDVVKAEAGAASTIGAARSGAEARAKLAPDIVAGEVGEAGRKSAAEATAKATVAAKAGQPWTAKDALTARTAATNQAQKEVAKGGLWGKVSPASGADVRKRAAEILKAEGLDENGQMVVGAHTITATGPDGKKMVLRSGEWVPM
jgi:hypothetical protein